MGSRTERGYIPDVINPQHIAGGYAHIIKRAEEGEYSYISNLASPVIKVGLYDASNGFSLDAFKMSFKQTGKLTIPFLPSITTIPPAEIVTRDLVEEKIQAAQEQILGLLKPDTNIITCSHGSYWWFLPEQEIGRLLENEGYFVNPYFPRVGGRKRIQEHALLLSR